MDRGTTRGEIPVSFITDESVREGLKDDWRQANKAYTARVYAAAVVLCGAVLEGLLTWAISTREEEARQRHPNRSRTKAGKERPLPRWSLDELIPIGRPVGLV